jgi:LPXTG-motif cell wall-anchored protein
MDYASINDKFKIFWQPATFTGFVETPSADKAVTEYKTTESIPVSESHKTPTSNISMKLVGGAIGVFAMLFFLKRKKK